MKNRSEFLTFIAACIPGVGYMYNGLIKKGVQFLFLFMLIPPVFHFVGLGFLSPLIRIPLWFYTFFDTFSIAKKIDHGEYVPDSEFVFKNYIDMNAMKKDEYSWNNRINKQGWVIIGCILILLGTLSIFNQVFIDSDIYKWLRFHTTQYFMPILFIFAGILILTRKRS